MAVFYRGQNPDIMENIHPWLWHSYPLSQIILQMEAANIKLYIFVEWITNRRIDKFMYKDGDLWRPCRNIYYLFWSTSYSWLISMDYLIMTEIPVCTVWLLIVEQRFILYFEEKTIVDSGATVYFDEELQRGVICGGGQHNLLPWQMQLNYL